MTDLPHKVTFPWLNVEVDVKPDSDDVTGEEHLAIANMMTWTDSLRIKLERACFADYLDKVYSIAAKPPTVPAIKAPEQTWRHVEIRTVRPQGAAVIMVYAVPEWDIEEHHEWCIQGIDELVYVGQFLGYSADGYFDLNESINRARNYNKIIDELGHIPLQWDDA